MAKPIFTKHAREKMAQRGITKREVRTLLRSDAVTVSPGRPDPRGETEWWRGTVGGRRLKVLVTRADPQVVVTAAAVDE